MILPMFFENLTDAQRIAAVTQVREIEGLHKRAKRRAVRMIGRAESLGRIDQILRIASAMAARHSNSQNGRTREELLQQGPVEQRYLRDPYSVVGS